MRHGLSSKLLANPAVQSEIIALAEQIARYDGRPDYALEARMLAEAELSVLQFEQRAPNCFDRRAVRLNAQRIWTCSRSNQVSKSSHAAICRAEQLQRIDSSNWLAQTLWRLPIFGLSQN